MKTFPNAKISVDLFVVSEIIEEQEFRSKEANEDVKYLVTFLSVIVASIAYTSSSSGGHDSVRLSHYLQR